MPLSSASRLFWKFREEALISLTKSDKFREAALSSLVRFLKGAVALAEYPWKEIKVPGNRDLKLCIQYTAERRGQALIRTIVDLIVEMLTGKSDLVILFRDEKNPVFTGNSPATEKVFRVFEAAGGRFVAVRTEWLADFCALIQLRGEVHREEGGRFLAEVSEPLTREDYEEFLTGEFDSGFARVLADSIRLAVEDGSGSGRSLFPGDRNRFEAAGQGLERGLDRHPLEAAGSDKADGVGVFVDVSGIVGSEDGASVAQEEEV